MRSQLYSPFFALLIVLLGTSTPLAASSNTVLRVSVPPLPENSRNWESVSTQAIDGVLVNLPGGIYPANFTSDIAEDTIQDLNDLKNGLASGIATTLEADSDVKQVYSVTVSTNPVKASLWQKATSIGLTLSNIEIAVDLELETSGGIVGSLFCPSPDVQINIERLVARGSYNVYTGNLGDIDISYASLDVDSDCGGILGPIGDAFDQWFVNEQGAVENIIESQVGGLNNIASKVTVFSIRDLARAVFDSDLFQSTGSELTIDAVDEVLAQTDLDSGVIVDFEVLDGSNQNQVSLSARAEAPTLGQKQGSGTVKQLPITYPAGASSVSIYVSDHGGPLTLFTTTSASSINVSVNQNSHLVFVAIAHSDVVPGLRSNLSNASYFLGRSVSGGGPRS